MNVNSVDIFGLKGWLGIIAVVVALYLAYHLFLKGK